LSLQLDADRALALTYVPATRREALRTLWELDAALGAVLAGGREPLISQIKLAWWRDALVKLDTDKPPAEPMLQAVAAEILPRGVSGAELAEMAEGWTILLGQDPLTQAELSTYAVARGALLFRFSARVLAAELTVAMLRSGEGWALVDLARHSNPVDAESALQVARERLDWAVRWPAPLRPLGMLARLARRDCLSAPNQLEPHGAPARMWQMLRHRFSGS
jgi:phytoene synthase